MTRDLIRAAGLHPATRWCVTVVGPDGQAIGHGCAHGRHEAPAFSPDSGTDPPRTGGSPPGSGSSPPGGGSSPRAAVMARPAGAAVPAATGRPATAAVPAARVPAVVLKAAVPATAAARPATAAARPATAAARAVPGTGRGTRRQARYHRFPP